MALNPLDNPLERLGVLPNGMNWRGGWDATEQYYLNDVVVSPANSASYILAGKTTLLGGADPTLNLDWIELSAPTTGVQSVSAGVGINMTGTPTNPIVNNSGVITTTAGAGITNTGTAQNPIITNTGVITTTAGLGIQITGTTANPTITNDGIRTITAGSGIVVGAGNNPSISSTGILSLIAGTGLSSTGGQNPTLANTGVLSVVGGNGIVSTGGQNPTLSFQPLASGVAKIPNPLVQIQVTTPFILTPNAQIQLTYYNDNNVPPNPPPTCANPVFGQTLWWNLMPSGVPNTDFQIETGATPPVNEYLLVKWVLLSQ